MSDILWSYPPMLLVIAGFVMGVFVTYAISKWSD